MIAAIAAALLLAPAGQRAFTRAVLGPEPLRAYVDLGPVAIAADVRDRKQFTRALQIEADRLGADGFFVSEGDLTAIYAPEMTTAPDWGGSLGPFLVVPMVFAAITSKPAPKNPVAIRAYTLRELTGSKRDALHHVAAQLVTGQITIAEFEARRLEVLAN